MSEHSTNIDPRDEGSFSPPLVADGSGFGHPLSGPDPNWTPPEPEILEPVVPPDLVAIFGDPPLLPGETRADFEQHWAKVRRALKPRDAIAEVFAYNAAVTSWQLIGYRRLRARQLDQPFAGFLRKALQKAHKEAGEAGPAATEAAERLTAAVMQGDPAGRSEAAALLATIGDSFDALAGRALNDVAFDLARLDYLIVEFEAQWHRTLKEAGRYKEHLAALAAAARQPVFGDERLWQRPR